MINVRYKNAAAKNNLSIMTPYRTSDLYLSAFLRAKGVIIQNINRKNGKVIFIFQNDGKIQDLINKYFNDSDVPVLRFKAALRDLRSIIFDYQDSLLVKENQNG